jgi:RNA polymerase primary sigma factor
MSNFSTPNADSCHSEIYSSYIRDISVYPLLDTKEEAKLGRLAGKGNRKAHEKLVQSNLRLVVKYAHEFVGMGLPLMDMISEGNRGLMKAARRYDPTRSKFSTYATYWIKQFIRRALENQAKEIRHPSHVVTALSKIRRFGREYEQKYQIAPSCEEIARGTKLPLSKVKRLTRETIHCVSWNEKVGEDGAVLGDFLEDEKAISPADTAAENSDRETLIQLMREVLSDKERRILALRFGMNDGDDGMTLEDVGVHFDVTRERIRQIQAEAIEKLRAHGERLRAGIGRGEAEHELSEVKEEMAARRFSARGAKCKKAHK